KNRGRDPAIPGPSRSAGRRGGPATTSAQRTGKGARRRRSREEGDGGGPGRRCPGGGPGRRCPGGGPSAGPLPGSGRWRAEDCRQLGRRGHLELVVGALGGGLVVAPPGEPGGVAEAHARQVLVADLDDTLGPERLPRQVLG